MSRFREIPGSRWPAAACLQLWLDADGWHHCASPALWTFLFISECIAVAIWSHLHPDTKPLAGLFCFFFSRCWRLMPPISVSAWCSGPTGMSRSPASWGPLWLGRPWGSSWALTSWRPMGWRSTTKRRSSTSQMGALEKLRDVTMTVLADTWVGSPNTCASVSGWLTALHLCSISEWRML